MGGSDCALKYTLGKTAPNTGKKRKFLQNAIYHFHMIRFYMSPEIQMGRVYWFCNQTEKTDGEQMPKAKMIEF